MLRRTVTYLSLATILTNVAGCSGDDGSGANAGDNTVVEATTCGIEDAEIFVAPRVYSEESPVSDLQVSAKYLVYAPYYEVYWMPIDGGEPTAVPGSYDSGYGAGPVSGNEILQVKSRKLKRVQISSGEVTEEALPDSCSNGPVYSPDESILYCEDGTSYTDATTVDFWSYNVKSQKVTKLFAGDVAGDQSDFVATADTLYIKQEGGDDIRDAIYTVPVTGGQETELPLPGDYTFKFIGVGTDGLYIRGKPIASYEETNDYGGVYRIPFEGGAVEQVLEAYPDFSDTDLVVVDNTTILRFVNRVYEITPEGKAELLLESACPIFAMNATKDHLFLSARIADTYAYELLRIPR